MDPGDIDDDLSDALRDPYTLTHAFIRAVCAIEVLTEAGVGIGTGFHIGRGYVVTAAHVLAEAKQAATLFHHDIGPVRPPDEPPAKTSAEIAAFMNRWEALNPLTLAKSSITPPGGMRRCFEVTGSRWTRSNAQNASSIWDPNPFTAGSPLSRPWGTIGTTAC